MWEKFSLLLLRVWLSSLFFLFFLLNVEPCEDRKKNTLTLLYSSINQSYRSVTYVSCVYLIWDHGFISIPSIWGCRTFSPSLRGWPKNPGGAWVCLRKILGFAFSITACFCRGKFFRNCKINHKLGVLRYCIVPGWFIWCTIIYFPYDMNFSYTATPVLMVRTWGRVLRRSFKGDPFHCCTTKDVLETEGDDEEIVPKPELFGGCLEPQLFGGFSVW